MKKLPLLPLAIWSVVILSSLSWNLHENDQDATRNALIEGGTYIELNRSYRQWAAEAGGVYVPADRISPNPYLKVLDRDVTTSEGRKLTLVNPAYMTRMVFDIVKKKPGMPVISKITSLKYLNPENAPDEFEKKALMAFERGEKEANEITVIRGAPYLRLMKPFLTEQPCLKCHGFQGYRVGDVRGGLSIAVPLKPYYESETGKRNIIIFSHFLIWFIVSVGIAVIARNRRKQQENVEASELKFRTLAESADDWEFWINEKQEFVFMTPSSTKVTGYGLEEFRSDPGLMARIIHPEDREVWVKHLDDCAAPQHKEIELRIVTRDGDRKWLSHACSPMYANGLFLGRRACNKDITARKQQEEELTRKNELLEKIFSSTHFMIAYLDRDFNFIRVNKAYAEADGRAPSFFIGKNHFALYPSEENEAIFRGVVRTGESFTVYEKPFEYPGYPERGVTYWDWSLVPILDGAGGVESLVFSLKDVTTRRKAEEEKRNLEDQLRHAQKMEAIGTLAGGIAHDFNNILNVILGYGTMARDRLADDEVARGQIDEVLAAADRAANLTRRLLTFSRKQVVEVKPVNVNEIIAGVEKMLSRIIGEDIALVMSPANTDLVVMADSGQIEQVLMNLVSNARDAMPNGGRLQISTEIMEMDEDYIATHGYGKTGPYALISVTDTGGGMDEETQKKIFEPFFTTKGIGEGTGLGLAIAYGIVKQHDGYVQVYSKEGEGTRLNILLPLIEEAAAVRPEVESTGSLKGGTEAILLAEDDGSLRKLSRIVLESFGYTVIAAENGEEAIDRFMENRDKIRLAILDMIMPGKSGREVCEAIKKESPLIKILFISGYTMDLIHREELRDQDVDFILKPISPKDLVKKVREALDG